MKKEKKGIVYRFLYGNDKKDFKEDKLPKNRKEVFFHIFHDKIRLVMLLSLALTIFFLPLLIWFHMKNVYIKSEIIYPENIEMTKEAYFALRAFTINLVASLIAIPLYLFASIGCSGGFYVARRIVWGEGLIFKDDFLIGIKKSWFRYFIMSFIFSISSLIYTVNFSFIQLNIHLNVLLKTAILFLSFIQFIFFISLTMYVFTEEAIYKQPFKQSLKNGLLFSFGKLPSNLLILILSLLPIIIFTNLPNLLYQGIGLFLIAIFGFAYIVIIWTLYSHFVFDKYINSKYCQEIVEKGIYRKGV